MFSYVTAPKTAEVYGGSAEVEMISEVPPLICDPVMTDEMAAYMKELPIPGLTPVPNTSASASEDFATIAAKVPSVFMYLSAGYMDERGDAPPTTRRSGSTRTSVPSARPAWLTAQSAGWRIISEVPCISLQVRSGGHSPGRVSRASAQR